MSLLKRNWTVAFFQDGRRRTVPGLVFPRFWTKHQADLEAVALTNAFADLFRCVPDELTAKLPSAEYRAVRL